MSLFSKGVKRNKSQAWSPKKDSGTTTESTSPYFSRSLSVDSNGAGSSSSKNDNFGRDTIYEDEQRSSNIRAENVYRNGMMFGSRNAYNTKTKETKNALFKSKPQIVKKEEGVIIHTRTYEYPMREIPIKFPFKAYPCQVIMMSKIIEGLISGENCLLESPTGTGKTLTLLCSVLAWLKKCQESNTLYCPKKSLEKTPKHCTCDQSNNDCGPRKKQKSAYEPISFCDERAIYNSNEKQINRFKSEITTLSQADSQYECIDLSQDDSFDAGDITHEQDDSMEIDGNATFISDDGGYLPDSQEEDIISKCPYCIYQTFKSLDYKPPKIYYGTRTHKQIEQVVREFKKTEYKKVPMAILSSRDRTCINLEVATHPDKNDICADMAGKRFNRSLGRQMGKCPFYLNSEQITNNYSLFLTDINGREADSPWDLEELVGFGRKNNCCPYFATKDFHESANIVFAPYNYLIDPIIRQSSEIKLENAIVIFDEAHNIEDTCRDAASLSMTLKEIRELRLYFETLAGGSTVPDSIKKEIESFAVLTAEFHKKVSEISQNLNVDHTLSSFEEDAKVFNGQEAAVLFESIGLGCDDLNSVVKDLIKLSENDNEKKEKPKDNVTIHSDETTEQQVLEFKIHKTFLMQLEKITHALNFMFSEKLQFVEDYECAIIKRLARSNQKSTKLFSQKSKRKNDVPEDAELDMYDIEFNLWCMNPAVAFLPIQRKTHCTIITSGTLSPLDTFKGELQTEFKNTIETKHVVGESQVWAGIVSKGPSGYDLNCSFKASESFKFQDELGETLYQICRITPNGLLVFFPSYSMMSKLLQRWEGTALTGKLKNLKDFFIEPQRGNPREFDAIMCEYISSASGKGALLFAVCRGKISEGLDFADEQARAVVTVGIPFPNVRNLQIDLKRKHNDRKACKNKEILPGSKWYESQAFRALNQAFGRCIRHRNDWGAIILIDSRLNYHHYQNALSKWLRPHIKTVSYSQMTKSLVQFNENMKNLNLG